jgi:hypothetical protein
MPYFNRALLVIPVEPPATLFCGLSPRVYGWIRSVTTIEDVRPAGNFAKPLFEMAVERKWTRIGGLDLDQFPSDIVHALRVGSVEITNVKSAEVFSPSQDEIERSMRLKAAAMAKEILTAEMASGPGSVDHHFVGRLERRFRRAGAEDLIVLLTNGRAAPAPPTGAILEDGYSVSVAMEYRGHWVRISRPHASAEALQSCEKALLSAGTATSLPEGGKLRESMDGSYPYECGSGAISAVHIELHRDGKRLFYGDMIL